MYTDQETSFWRHADQCWVIVECLKRLCKRRAMLVWSAGCATGEEPYSVAIAVRERVPAHAIEHIHILATDSSPEAIAQAERASYRDRAFQGAPQELRERYFSAAEDGGWTLDDKIRDAVNFRCEAILDTCKGLADGSVDAIIFRNVAESLDYKALEEIYQQFARVLVPEGILLIAPSDPPPRGFTCVEVRHSLFRRNDANGEAKKISMIGGGVSANAVKRLMKHG